MQSLIVMAEDAQGPPINSGHDFVAYIIICYDNNYVII